MLTPRTVHLTKGAHDRVGMSLAHGATRRDIVVVDSVSLSSPLCGKVFPGDHVLEMNGAAARDPSRVARECTRTSDLTLVVLSPLGQSVSVQFLKDSPDDLFDLELERDNEMGLPCVKRSTTPVIHDLELGLSKHSRFLEPGDIVVSVSARGTQWLVTSVKDAMARLREAPQGVVEVRVVRTRDSALDEAHVRPPPTASVSSLHDGRVDLHRINQVGDSGRTSPTSLSSGSDSGKSDGMLGRISLVPRPPSPVEGSLWRARTERLRTKSHGRDDALRPAERRSNSTSACWPQSAPELFGH